jgi:hypothetical protein
MRANIRKNFVIDAQVAAHLEEMARDNGQSQTALVQEMIEERYRSARVRKRVEAFERSMELAKALTPGFTKNKTIQQIKAEMDV